MSIWYCANTHELMIDETYRLQDWVEKGSCRETNYRIGVSWVWFYIGEL